MARKDPILYYQATVGSIALVAVLDQFGEFPNEKRLTETLKKIDFTLI